MSETAQINPKILTWARETAGLSVDEAAERLGLRDSAKATAAEKLAAMERGSPEPSSTTLQKAAAIYRRPLIAFYMAEPPACADRGEDFRTAPGYISKRDKAILDALVGDVRGRQEMLHQILEDKEEAGRREFVGSVSMRQGPKHAVA
jgi:transcriptional regulator with XRE-family HTH domain